MHVFRIEHPESGKGPFTHQCARNRFASDAMVYMKEPQEFNVKGASLGCGSPHVYAFKDVESLLRNVQSLVLLREMGFHIAVYESHEHIVLPDGQVAFIKDVATLVEAHFVHEFPFENYF